MNLRFVCCTHVIRSERAMQGHVTTMLRFDAPPNVLMTESREKGSERFKKVRTSYMTQEAGRIGESWDFVLLNKRGGLMHPGRV